MSFRRQSLAEYVKKEPVFFTGVCRYLASFIVSPLVRTRITANQITYLVFICGIIPGVLFATGAYSSIVIAALLVQWVSVFDCVDGMVARAKEKTSKYGVWLDNNFDKMVDFGIFFGMTYGIYIRTGNPAVWPLGFIAISLRYMMEILRKNTLETGISEEALDGKMSYIAANAVSFSNIYFVMLFFALFNQLYLFLLVFDVYYAAAFIASLVYLRGKVKDK